MLYVLFIQLFSLFLVYNLHISFTLKSTCRSVNIYIYYELQLILVNTQGTKSIQALSHIQLMPLLSFLLLTHETCSFVVCKPCVSSGALCTSKYNCSVPHIHRMVRLPSTWLVMKVTLQLLSCCLTMALMFMLWIRCVGVLYCIQWSEVCIMFCCVDTYTFATVDDYLLLSITGPASCSPYGK